ncbi:MAG TPA: hypothetical protein VGM08_04935 [Candidatus Saccharimonadales bacterium]|jgi:predicted alpha/beta hydrolase family esterase
MGSGPLVSAWPGDYLKTDGEFDWEPGQFSKLFPPEGFDIKTIKGKADRLAFLHGAKDSYCPVEATEQLAKQFDAPITIIPDAEHFSGVTELSELWQIIEPSL